MTEKTESVMETQVIISIAIRNLSEILISVTDLTTIENPRSHVFERCLVTTSPHRCPPLQDRTPPHLFGRRDFAYFGASQADSRHQTLLAEN